MLVFVVGQKSSHYFPSDYIEMFQRNVQALPAKNEVIVELQPYIENVLRADDPKFWEKLRYEKSSGKVWSFSQIADKWSETQTDFTEGALKDHFFSRLDLPEKEPDKVDTPVASSSQGGGTPLYPALDEEML